MGVAVDDEVGLVLEDRRGEAVEECRSLVGAQFTAEAVDALAALQASPQPLLAA